MSNGAEPAPAAAFDPPRRADWERLVDGALSRTGSRPEDLITTTDDDIAIRPLYTADDTVPEAGQPGLPPFVRGARPEGNVLTGWDVRARHADPDPAAATEA
ncbi:methylmalonyl-CoA mutase family protein, partial [Saccharomonospora iraqiensis]|uniref:methylmalonyl-CoA mutase family protein n=1 Tax=Saccharomonospora iraqiensis TaxID=52698 RepID=UPI000555D5D1